MKDSEFDHYYNELKDATLEVIEQTPNIAMFRLRKYQNTDMNSAVLLFTPYGTDITGDMRIENHGVQAIGYGLRWFAEKGHDAEYLAEKFLERKWIPDRAQNRFREWAANIREQINADLAIAREEAAEYLEVPVDQVTDEMLKEGGYLDGISFPMRKWRVYSEEFEGTEADALEKLLKDETMFEQSLLLYYELPSYWDDKKKRWLCPYDSEMLSLGYGYDEPAVGWLYAIQHRFAECYAALPSPASDPFAALAQARIEKGIGYRIEAHPVYNGRPAYAYDNHPMACVVFGGQIAYGSPTCSKVFPGDTPEECARLAVDWIAQQPVIDLENTNASQ